MGRATDCTVGVCVCVCAVDALICAVTSRMRGDMLTCKQNRIEPNRVGQLASATMYTASRKRHLFSVV